MSSGNHTGKHPHRRWPAWAEPLRPDDVTRARLAREILARARPLLRARRESWQDVASGWASMLAPIAAVLLLFFTALAYRASETRIEVAGLGPEPVVELAPAGPATVEELVGGAEAAPWLLTGAEEPSADAVLAAVMEPAPAAAPSPGLPEER